MSQSVSISDPVHGSCRFKGLPARIINLQEFNRLKFIAQLGLASEVYPMATHTRKAHSLGAAHIATIWIDHLKKDAKVKIISERQQELIVTAALCHDLGHIAFSHLFDTLIERIYVEQKKEHKWPENLRTHERRSVTLLRKMNTDHTLGLSEKELTFIEAVIHGRALDGYPPWMFCIVSSFVDCDRLDYLLRDSHGSGVPVSFRLQRILINSKIIEGKLCFNVKIKKDLLQMAQSRRYLHSEVYQHKTTIKFQRMLLDILWSHRARFGLDDSFCTKWIHLVDASVWSHLMDLQMEGDVLARRFLSRQLYKSYVFDEGDELERDTTLFKHTEKININLGGSKECPDFVSGIHFFDPSTDSLMHLKAESFPIRSELLSWNRIYVSNEGVFNW